MCTYIFLEWLCLLIFDFQTPLCFLVTGSAHQELSFDIHSTFLPRKPEYQDSSGNYPCCFLALVIIPSRSHKQKTTLKASLQTICRHVFEEMSSIQITNN